MNIQCKTHGSRSMPEAIGFRTGKPYIVGGPLETFYICREAGLRRKPCYVYKGSPTQREAQSKLHCRIHGSRSVPGAIECSTGKPDTAGGTLSESTYARRLL